MPLSTRPLLMAAEIPMMTQLITERQVVSIVVKGTVATTLAVA